MLNYRNLNILFFSVLAVIIVAEYFFSQICFLPVFVLVAVYLALIAWGSSKIQLDFYFTSLHRGNTEKKEIALTFDDGPHPEFTPMGNRQNNIRISYLPQQKRIIWRVTTAIHTAFCLTCFLRERWKTN